MIKQTGKIGKHFDTYYYFKQAYVKWNYTAIPFYETYIDTEFSHSKDNREISIQLLPIGLSLCRFYNKSATKFADEEILRTTGKISLEVKITPKDNIPTNLTTFTFLNLQYKDEIWDKAIQKTNEYQKIFYKEWNIAGELYVTLTNKSIGTEYKCRIDIDKYITFRTIGIRVPRGTNKNKLVSVNSMNLTNSTSLNVLGTIKQSLNIELGTLKQGIYTIYRGTHHINTTSINKTKSLVFHNTRKHTTNYHTTFISIIEETQNTIYTPMISFVSSTNLNSG